MMEVDHRESKEDLIRAHFCNDGSYSTYIVIMVHLAITRNILMCKKWKSEKQWWCTQIK